VGWAGAGAGARGALVQVTPCPCFYCLFPRAAIATKPVVFCSEIGVCVCVCVCVCLSVSGVRGPPGTGGRLLLLWARQPAFLSGRDKECLVTGKSRHRMRRECSASSIGHCVRDARCTPGAGEGRSCLVPLIRKKVFSRTSRGSPLLPRLNVGSNVCWKHKRVHCKQAQSSLGKDLHLLPWLLPRPVRKGGGGLRPLTPQSQPQ
jgi:hypothetical protein